MLRLYSLGQCVIAAFLILVSHAPVLSGQDGASAATIAPGDLLQITVWRREELSGKFVVAPDGSISHPLYRELHVAGLSLPQIEQRIRTFLLKYETTPELVVVPLFRIIVGGEVRQPNVYTIPPGTTIGEAIAQAGGPTERGRLDRVRLSRRDGSTSVLDLTQSRQEIARTVLLSGDAITVARRRNIFQDVIAPSSSVLGAVAAIVGVIVTINRGN